MEVNSTISSFIECWEQHRCLWDPADSTYHNKNVRNAAYNELLQIIKIENADASLKEVNKRIDNLRTVFKRESIISSLI